MDNSNQRRFSRQKEETAVQVFLNPAPGQSRYDSRSFIPAIICNQSEEGFHMVIDRALQPGSNVSIKIVEREGGRPGNAYYRRDGLVVWCNQIDVEASRFGIGIKILRKIVQSDVLSSRF